MPVVVSSKLLCYTTIINFMICCGWQTGKNTLCWQRPPSFCQLHPTSPPQPCDRLLRAGEIANLTWDMVLDPTGNVGSVIELHDIAAKNGSGRLIPVHPDLQALAAYRGLATRSGPLIRSQRGGPMTSLSIVVWFNRAFRNIGLHGCSSHSGRRTFITRAARLVHKPVGRCAMSNCSLVTDRSKQPSGTSTATAMCSASWSR